MDKNARIFVSGHRGLVGSAIVRILRKKGYSNLLVRTRSELDLRHQNEVFRFFEEEKPEYVFLAAAKVGGILANNTYKAEFIYDNLVIAANAIEASYRSGVKKLLNLGSSCVYPKLAPQPLKEEYLLSGYLEPTNEPYAVAKIAALKLCRYYNEQYGTNFISLMPTNLYGEGDNFNLETSHVLPALIRKLHLAKLLRANQQEKVLLDIRKRFLGYGLREGELSFEKAKDVLKNKGVTGEEVILWGSGAPRREFLHVDDLAEASIFLMGRYGYKDVGEFINVGTGKDNSIRELAEIVGSVVGFDGRIAFDTTKPDGTPRKLLDVSRMKSLGWEAHTSLDEGIRKTYEWYTSM